MIYRVSYLLYLHSKHIRNAEENDTISLKTPRKVEMRATKF